MIRLWGLASSMVFFPVLALAHGGGLDSYGCHRNRKQGGYHCHRGAYAGRAWSSRAPGRWEMNQAAKAKYDPTTKVSNSPRKPSKDAITLGTNMGFSLERPMRCVYQENQSILQENNLNWKNLKQRSDRIHLLFERGRNSTALDWTFKGILGDKPRYESGGDQGQIINHSTVDGLTQVAGVSLFLSQKNGAHLFSIWETGLSIWAKHNSLAGAVGAQTFVGTCVNVKGI